MYKLWRLMCSCGNGLILVPIVYLATALVKETPVREEE
jgi:hypothetical protein